MSGHGEGAPIGHFLSPLRMVKEIPEGGRKSVVVGNLADSVHSDQFAHDIAEILHMGADDNRFS